MMRVRRRSSLAIPPEQRSRLAPTFSSRSFTRMIPPEQVRIPPEQRTVLSSSRLGEAEDRPYTAGQILTFAVFGGIKGALIGAGVQALRKKDAFQGAKWGAAIYALLSTANVVAYNAIIRLPEPNSQPETVALPFPSRTK